MPSAIELECELGLTSDESRVVVGPEATMPEEILIRERLAKHYLLRPGDVDRICSQEHRTGGLVEGLITRRSISVLIGDSGLGKSPLAYQLGLCVAEGLPFLGLKTDSAPVVYADYENGLEQSRDLRDQLMKFLHLRKAADNFMVWTPDCGRSLDLEGICRDVKPSLFIIDSLRSHDPFFEKNDFAGQGMNSLRSLAYKHGVAVLVIHHVRKPGPEGVPALDSEDTVLMEWLNQASGHRSLINQSDSRIAAGLSKRVPDAAMVLRWHRRVKGEAGILFVARVLDDEGGELGYKVMVGPELLANPDQRAAFAKLPQRFTFKEAKRTYERTDDPTRKWLLKCEAAGLVAQVGRGLYERLSERERGLAPDTVPRKALTASQAKTIEQVENEITSVFS